MSYEITGTIVSKGETKQVSEKFKVREFAIKVMDGGQYDNFASFQVVQDRVSLLDGIKKGEQLTVHFDIRGREKDGKYWTNLNAWKIEVVGQSSADSPPAPTPAAAPEPVAEASDDLPF